MRRALVIAIAVAACTGHPHPTPITGTIAAHVTSYDFTFDVDTRAAHAIVTAVVDTAGDCWTLPLRAGAPTNVTIDGAPATSATASATSLKACGAGHAAGAQLVLAVDTTFALATLGPSQVGYSITKDAQQNPFYYLVSWVGGCDQFAPCDNSPNVFATYRFDVTHPASLAVRCPGTVVDVSPTETTCTFEHDGGPTYSTFGVAAYPAWTQTDEGTWGASAHVTVYDRPSTGIVAQIDPTYHAGFVAFMERTFGPYPYGGELRVLTAPTYWNGFEHPTNIVLADTLSTQKNSGYAHNVAHVLDHEMAHMWAGDQTTLAGSIDFAWKEAMAEYLSYVWEDMNDAAVASTTAAAWKLFGSTAKFYAVPQDTPAPELITYYGDVYGPGPMILFRQLEVMSSRAQVIAALQSLLGTPHAISIDDVLAALATKTGIDLSGYRKAWLENSGAPKWPQIDLTYTAAATTTLAIHDVTAQTPYKGCKFHVALHGANATDVALVAIDTFGGGPDQTIVVQPPAFPVTSLEIDPLHECLVFLGVSSPRTLPVVPSRVARPWVAVRTETP
jgi:aminopeptidase N